MKTYRFVTKAHHDVFAETLEEAIEAFNEIKQKGLSPKVDMVSRIEVRTKKVNTSQWIAPCGREIWKRERKHR